jgi:hypothetical protein
MASILKVDELRGIVSAGDITVTSEGGAATQSLQQGLAKAWVNFNGIGTIAARDSFNTSSLTDNGTGNYYVNFSSSMANTGYSVTNSVDGDGIVSGAMTETRVYNLGYFGVRGMNPQSSYANTDFLRQSCSTFGDLA